MSFSITPYFSYVKNKLTTYMHKIIMWKVEHNSKYFQMFLKQMKDIAFYILLKQLMSI